MNRSERRARAVASRAYVATLPARLVQVPQAEWPPYPPGGSPPPIEVWRSRSFLVQVYQALKGQVRISVQRTDGADGITWDQLQSVKAEIGRGHLTAVELYPPAEHLVDVANMRHLWTLPELPAWAWRKW